MGQVVGRKKLRYGAMPNPELFSYFEDARSVFARALLREDLLSALENDAAFSKLVKQALHFDVQPAHLARATKSSVATISRWANGKTAPHPLVRRVVAEEIRKLLNGERTFSDEPDAES